MLIYFNRVDGLEVLKYVWYNRMTGIVEVCVIEYTDWKCLYMCVTVE
jgi:hypothetical protein